MTERPATEQTKICHRCLKTLPISMFKGNHITYDGRCNIHTGCHGNYDLLRLRTSVHTQSRRAKKRGVQNTLTIKDVIELAAQQDCRCHWCGRKLRFRADFAIDHITPMAIGGANSIDNVVISCKACNESRQDGRHSARKRARADAEARWGKRR